MCFLCSVSLGLEDYLKRYREGMRRVLSSFGPVPEFDGEAATRINKVCAAFCQAIEELMQFSEMNYMNKVFVVTLPFLSN